MKIILFAPNMTQVGGIERLISILSNKFSENENLEMEIVNLGTKNGKEKFNLNKNIKIKYINVNEKDLFGMSMIKKFSYTFYTFCKAKKYFKKYKFSDEKTIIIAFGHTLSLILAYSLKSSNKVKLIGSQHNPITYNKIYNILRNIYLKKLDRYVVLNGDMRNDIIDKCDINNVVVIENPNTISNAKISKGNNKEIIAVGRLTTQKNFALLLEIWNKINCEMSEWKLKIIGEGSEKQNLIDIIDKYNLNESVTIEGFTNNIVEKYYESDIFVMTSEFEGFGLVIVEAQSCGLPVVVFDCPTGPRNIINNDKDGYLVPMGDMDQFIEKLKRLMVDEKLRDNFSKNAIENSNRFSIECIVKKWMLLFEDLLENQ